MRKMDLKMRKVEVEREVKLKELEQPSKHKEEEVV